jgi:hypothetical protein
VSRIATAAATAAAARIFFSADGCVRSLSFFFSGAPKTLTVDGDNRTAATTTADGGHRSR